MSRAAQGLRSSEIYPILKVVLLIRLGIACLGAVLAMFGNLFASLSGFNASIGWLVGMVSLVMFPIWLYQLHYDLIQGYKGYAISPEYALVQFIVPLYNIFGIWNIFSTLSQRLKRSRMTRIQGEDLQQNLLALYICRGINWALLFAMIISLFSLPSLIGFLAFISAVLSVITLGFDLQIVNGITDALHKQANTSGGGNDSVSPATAAPEPS